MQIIDQKSYNMMVIAMMVVTGTISPIVKVLYHPSKKYRSSVRRRTIEHATSTGELRLLVCIHHLDNTPSIINLLELSNPTIKSPICFYLVHLLQLTGRAAPLLISHDSPGPTPSRVSQRSNLSDQILHAFHLYQNINHGKVIMNAFTCVAPYATMHDDVCMLALEKWASMVIVPFHKRRTINGMVESSNALRGVNEHILSKAPCSVGILIDHMRLMSATSASLLNRVDLYRVGLIFLEGADDREALAYATRMAEHMMVSLTVVRLIEPLRNPPTDYKLDMEMINEFKMIMETSGMLKNCIYEEHVVCDCVGLINVIRQMETNYDMIIVGRRHDSDSPLFMGLNEWNVYPELGHIGDMLASSDSTTTAAVLVIQQQIIVSNQVILDDFHCLVEDSYPVDMKPLNVNLTRPLT